MVGLGFSPLRGFERRVWSVSCCFCLVSVFLFYVAFNNFFSSLVLVLFVIFGGLQSKSTDSCRELRCGP